MAGDVPIGASFSRIIFLSNFHQDEVMDFAVVLSSSLAKDVLEVRPPRLVAVEVRP